MNLQLCSKRHYFDGDKFSECPYCSGEAGTRPYMSETEIDIKDNFIVGQTLSSNNNAEEATEIIDGNATSNPGRG